MINVPEHHLSAIKQILQRYIPDITVKAFGSRLTEKVKKYSDLDLVIIGKEEIDSLTLIKLKDAFEESDIPFRIDILDYHKISKEFQQIINKQSEIIQ